MRLYSILLLLLIALTSCKQTNLASEGELKAYIEEEGNGLIQKAKLDDGSIEVTYKPADLILLQNYKQEIKARKGMDSLHQALDKYVFFVMRISRNNAEIENSYLSDPARMEEVVKYLSFEADKDITVKADQKEIGLADYHYVRMFGTTGATAVMLAIERKAIKESEEIHIAFDATQLGLGVQYFLFETKDILNTPTIKFS